MYLVINAENLKLFEPSLLDDDLEEGTHLPSIDDLCIKQEDPLEEDYILEQKIRETRRGKHKYFTLVGKDNFQEKNAIFKKRQKLGFLISHSNLTRAREAMEGSSLK